MAGTSQVHEGIVDSLRSLAGRYVKIWVRDDTWKVRNQAWRSILSHGKGLHLARLAMGLELEREESDVEKTSRKFFQ